MEPEIPCFFRLGLEPRRFRFALTWNLKFHAFPVSAGNRGGTDCFAWNLKFFALPSAGNRGVQIGFAWNLKFLAVFRLPGGTDLLYMEPEIPCCCPPRFWNRGGTDWLYMEPEIPCSFSSRPEIEAAQISFTWNLEFRAVSPETEAAQIFF